MVYTLEMSYGTLPNKPSWIQFFLAYDLIFTRFGRDIFKCNERVGRVTPSRPLLNILGKTIFKLSGFKKKS